MISDRPGRTSLGVLGRHAQLVLRAVGVCRDEKGELGQQSIGEEKRRVLLRSMGALLHCHIADLSSLRGRQGPPSPIPWRPRSGRPLS
jgi:hypothetical protein